MRRFNGSTHSQCLHHRNQVPHTQQTDLHRKNLQRHTNTDLIRRVQCPESARQRTCTRPSAYRSSETVVPASGRERTARVQLGTNQPIDSPREHVEQNLIVNDDRKSVPRPELTDSRDRALRLRPQRRTRHHQANRAQSAARRTAVATQTARYAPGPSRPPQPPAPANAPPTTPTPGQVATSSRPHHTGRTTTTRQDDHPTGKTALSGTTTTHELEVDGDGTHAYEYKYKINSQIAHIDPRRAQKVHRTRNHSSPTRRTSPHRPEQTPRPDPNRCGTLVRSSGTAR